MMQAKRVAQSMNEAGGAAQAPVQTGNVHHAPLGFMPPARTTLLHGSEVAALSDASALTQVSRSGQAHRSAVQESLAALSLFRGLDNETLATLCSRATLVVLPVGTELMRQGERQADLVCVLRGAAKLVFSSKSGLKGVSQVVAGPAVIGCAGVERGEQSAQCSLQLLEKSQLLLIPIDCVRVAMRGSPRLVENLLAESNASLREATALCRALMFGTADSKLARLLLRHLAIFGLPTHGGTMIRIQLTQSDFADALGLNRRSVTRALRAWAQRGVIKKRTGRYVVSDPAYLESVASAHE